MGNQIEEIKKLYAKSKSYKVPQDPKEGQEQITLEIMPLSLEDMGHLNMSDNMPLSDLSKNAKIMFSRSLGITEDEASKLSVEYLEDLLGAIMDANNFKEEEIKKTGIKDFIKQKQEQMKANQGDGKADRKA